MKTAMVDKAKIHLDRMEKQYKILKQKYEGTRFIPNRLWKTRDGCAFEYIVGDSMSKLLDEMLDMDDKAGAYELLQEEGLVTAMQGKGFQVNPQDSEMLKEQHMRHIEDGLTDAIKAAKRAGISQKELREIFEALLAVQE